LQTNAVVVQGRAGVLLIDPGVRGDEMTCLANDVRELGQPVVAGFATHPDWDPVLWHAELGESIARGRDRTRWLSRNPAGARRYELTYGAAPM
jgi:glyoxylase-like metal-dependent hydrolase (beta-lactamase superfamily II)